MDGTRYQKGGDAGSKGVGFQIDLLTMFLLNALQRFKDWRLSTENQRAGKFDDVVLEWPEGAVLLQAKHKKKKKITMEELLSTNSKRDDFSLPKYFLSYQEIKKEFKGTKTLIICSNADVHETILEFLDSQRLSVKSVLYCANNDYLFYTLNTKILPHLKQGIEEYLQKNNRNKNIDRSVITDENLNYFLDHLQIFANFPSDNDLEMVIEKLLSAMKPCNGLYEKIFHKELRAKITDWFQHKEGIYLTEVRAKAIFSELRTEKYRQTLEQYGVEFRHNDIQFPDSKRIYQMIVENGYLLQVIKIHHMLKNCKAQILSINPDDNIEVQRQVVQAFQLKQYIYLIIVWPKSTEESVMTEITDKLSATLKEHQYKKIILVTESSDEPNRLFGLSKSDLDVSFGSGKFNDLSDETRGKLLNKENIVFQGRDISLKELFPLRDSDDLEKAADLSLQKLIGDEKVIVGAPLMDLNQSLTHLYINRTFERHNVKTITDEEIKILYSEEDIYDVPGKIVLIADTAGMGKTTVLTTLAAVIKEKYPLLWVIKIELNDFAATLKDFLKSKRKTINVLDLLHSKDITRLSNELDNFVFAMEKRVVLMLDGVDEISPDYTDLVINLLLQCQEATNFAKVFITTRPHMVPELQKKLQVALFTLEPFTEKNQINFLTRYWTNCLHLIEGTDKKKCEKFARALVNKMSLTDLNNKVEDHFAAIPLQLRMLAEIFQNSMVSDESLDWEGCKEYIRANEEEPRLPETMNLTKLYEMFMDKKRDIFIEKENPNGHTVATRALRAQFEECFNFHRDIALNIVLSEEECHLFSRYGTSEDMEVDAVKIGIVQKLGCEFNFIHRTVAEYFVAQSIVRELQYKNQNPEFQKFLIHEVFFGHLYNTILAFFDNFLQEILDSIPSTIFQSYQSSISCMPLDIIFRRNIIHRLAQKNCVAVLHLILKCTNFIIIRNEEGSILELIKIKINNRNTLTYLQCMLKQVGLNLEDFYGRTPLYFAAREGHLKMVKFLVEHGANIDSDSINEYQSPLVEATLNGHNDVAKYLLEQALGLQTIGIEEEFKVNDSDMAAFLLEIVLRNNGLTIGKTMVPYVAAAKGCLSVLEASIERGINVDGKFENGETLIFGAVRGRQLSTIEYLVKKGANINSRDNRGRTALHLNAEEDTAVPTAELLVRLGIDVNIMDDMGNTALHIASNYIRVLLGWESGWLELLTNSGADVNIRNKRGNTPLHLTCNHFQSLKLVKLLVENGADITIKNHDGLTAFLMARDEDTLKFFVQVGMDVNTTDDKGHTLLHLQVTGGDIDLEYEKWEIGPEGSTLKFLLEQGINVNIMSNTGDTALHVAVRKRNLQAIKLFIEAGADVNAKNKEGRTPLHEAVVLYPENVVMVKFLTEQGANIESRDNKGRTPYVLAKKGGHLRLLQYLKEDAKSKSRCILV